jgi:hypothetical protein
MWSFGLIAFSCIVASFYLAWRDEYRTTVAVPWMAALEENRALQRQVREFIRIAPPTNAETERARPVTDVRAAVLAITVHLLSDSWLTQLPHFEAEGRKVRARCLQFQNQLSALRLPGIPFLKPEVMSLTAAEIGDCLEDNRVFLEKRVTNILAGRV